ncbi:MAG: BspA family leucine-rich repeat surface protein [Bergeyella cardium]
MKKYFLLAVSAVVLAVTAVNCSRNDDQDSGSGQQQERYEHLTGVWEANAIGQIPIPTDGDGYSYTYKRLDDPSETGKGEVTQTGQHTEYIELGMKNANKRFVISIIPKKEKFAFYYGIDGLVAEEKAQFKVLKHWGKRKWVGNLAGMFMGCSSLKIEAQDVPNFSNVTSVSSMFNGCTSLESVPNINQWNLSAVQDIHSMFEGATKFNQSLEGWVIKVEGAKLTDIFTNTAMSSENYGKTLKGWAENKETAKNVILSSDRKYKASAKQYRQSLIDNKGWTITDGGQE